MSRNDQVRRQWYLLKKIEKAGAATLDELVSSLPPDHACNPRTLRRDLDALSTDFPLYTDRAGGQTRWRLMEGFKAPALAFSPTELMSLMFSRDLMKPLDGTPMKDSLDAALSKVTSALPREALAYVRQMQGYLSVGMGPHKSYRGHRRTIEQLTRAIALKRTVQVRYYSASRNLTSRRDVDPYLLWYASGGLYLVAWCHRRRDVRLFAVDRVRALAITNRPCQLPLHFDLEAYLKDALLVMRGRPVEVELLFDRRMAAWVKDREWHPSQRLEFINGGALRMTLRVADTPELVGWILSLGGGVRVASRRPFARRFATKQKILEV